MLALTPWNNRRFSPSLNQRMFRDMDDLFNRLMWAPDMAPANTLSDFDLYEKDGKLHLSMEAPGVNPDTLEVKISKDGVSIRSKNENEVKEEKEEGKTWYNKKTVSAFNYHVSLPFDIDTDKAEAVFENGMIKVSAPRLQASESKILELKKA